VAPPTASHYETRGAITRTRGLCPLCEPAGGLWRRWGRLRWRRRWRWRVDHSYDDRRFDHDDDNGHHNYDECGNYNVVGRLVGAVKHLTQVTGAPAPMSENTATVHPIPAMLTESHGLGGCWVARRSAVGP
jgi:hypothetical protein